MKNAFFLSETEHNLCGEKPEVEFLFRTVRRQTTNNCLSHLLFHILFDFVSRLTIDQEKKTSSTVQRWQPKWPFNSSCIHQ